MELINDKNEVYLRIEKVKKNNIKYITNFFIDYEKLEEWIKEKSLFYIEDRNGLLFFRKKYNFFYLYYCCSSLQDIKYLLTDHSSSILCVVDLIGKFENIEPISDIFSNYGFNIYNQLDRYSRINNIGDNYYQFYSNVELAEMNQADKITEMLHVSFDKFVEQLYTIEEVKKLIQTEKILLIKDNETLKGFLIRNKLPQSTTLLNFLVNPNFRGEKIGSKLIKHYIYESKETKRMWLWVKNENKHAIDVYLNHGYKFDGLVDIIMINNKQNE